MQTIDKFNFAGKKAFVRVDFNVPLDKKTREVTDDTRIRGALKTIRKITADGGCAILMSHLGRPEGVMEKYSLKPVLPVLEKQCVSSRDDMRANHMDLLNDLHRINRHVYHIAQTLTEMSQAAVRQD